LSGQYVGFLIQKHLYQNLKKGGQAPKSIIIQEEAARENSLIPCYFPFKHLSAGRDQVLAIVSADGIYQEKIIQVPRVIYNREWSTPGRDRKIRYLTKKGVTVFNEGNYLKKYKFQALLEKKEEFSRHLPETKIANAQNLEYMMKKYNQLILKPDHGLVGKGIHKLYKVNEREWCLTFQIKNGKKRSWQEFRFTETIPKILQQLVENNFYLIQNLLPLATYQGSPFDFRVATQRNGTGHWEVTAIIGKVAGEGNFLTNIGQGGSAFTLDELIQAYPHLNADFLREQIVALAIKIANLFSDHLPHIGDLGFDFAITPDGDIYYIECNFISAYPALTMKNGVLMHDDWKNVFIKPVDYARFLLDHH